MFDSQEEDNSEFWREFFDLVFLVFLTFLVPFVSQFFFLLTLTPSISNVTNYHNSTKWSKNGWTVFNEHLRWTVEILSGEVNWRIVVGSESKSHIESQKWIFYFEIWVEAFQFK